MFSVVIPLYNKENTIERAIHSVLNQTVQHFEIIVVNDGSTDGGAQVVEEIGDSRIQLIHQINEGAAAARNLGVTRASHELVAFLDADDEWKPAFLETIRSLVRKYAEAAVFATSYSFREDQGKPRPAWHHGIPNPGWEGMLDDYFHIASRGDSPFCSSSVVVRKHALCAIGGFPVGVVAGEDLLTWARLAAVYPIAYSASQQSVYILQNTGHPAGFKRMRNTSRNDPVGDGLLRLLSASPRRRGLRAYCSRWYRIRAATCLAWGRLPDARYWTFRAIKMDYTNGRLYLYLIMAVLPRSLCMKTYAYLRSLGK